MAKKKQISVRERLALVVEAVEKHEALKRQGKVEKKEEKKEPVYTDVMGADLEDDERTRIMDNIYSASKLKHMLGSVKSGKGLLFEMDEMQSTLLQTQFDKGWDGMQLGDVKFRASVQDGRETLNAQKLWDTLLLKGVDLALIEECFQIATDRGAPFPVRKLTLPGMDD